MEALKFYSVTEPTCRHSDLNKPHTLSRRYDSPLSVCSACKGGHLEGSKYYYYCTSCNLEFHRGCHQFPPEITHPFHPSHPLTFVCTNPEYDLSLLIDGSKDYSSVSESLASDDDDDIDIDVNCRKCKSCWKSLADAYYHCSLCNFSLHLECSMRPPQVTISRLKSHEHTLTLFHTRIPLPCNACGLSLDDSEDFVYLCLPCSYMVHRKCIYLPRVIKLTRHPHRLSFTSVLSSNDFHCGVCGESVNVNHGQYSCIEACPYAVHSKCATRDNVWDGKDLEGVPEESEDGDNEPFTRIDEETIQHFSHDHYLSLHCNDIDSRGNQQDKFCQACVLPIMISESFYGCMQCDYILHEACARLPLRKNHALHKHSLILRNPFPLENPELWFEKYHEGFFRCSSCFNDSCGFVYECGEEGCEFQLDARCASLPDPFDHGSHDHPLYFSFASGRTCLACRIFSHSIIECAKCRSSLCLQCATIPCVAHYKYDRHPLTLCYGEEEDATNLRYWCEICESQIDAARWFYTCHYCKVTLHLRCLLGNTVYLKPRHRVKLWGLKDEYEVLLNSGNSRPLCCKCSRRCIERLVLKSADDEYICSYLCLRTNINLSLLISNLVNF